jgi:hypothetical protein
MAETWVTTWVLLGRPNGRVAWEDIDVNNDRGELEDLRESLRASSPHCSQFTIQRRSAVV